MNAPDQTSISLRDKYYAKSRQSSHSLKPETRQSSESANSHSGCCHTARQQPLRGSTGAQIPASKTLLHNFLLLLLLYNPPRSKNRNQSFHTESSFLSTSQTALGESPRTSLPICAKQRKRAATEATTPAAHQPPFLLELEVPPMAVCILLCSLMLTLRDSRGCNYG